MARDRRGDLVASARTRHLGRAWAAAVSHPLDAASGIDVYLRRGPAPNVTARHTWIEIAMLAGGALAAEAIGGFGPFFNPGWANGWPGRLSIHVVWPAGMAAGAGVMLMTAAVAGGALLAAG